MTGFRKISRNVDFWPKMAIFDHFYPLKEAKNYGRNFSCKKVKLRVHTLLTRNHTSKLDHFWVRYLQKMVKKPLLCNHMQCIFDQKRTKTAKTRFFLELSLAFFKSKPKIQFEYAKLRRSYDRISKN